MLIATIILATLLVATVILLALANRKSDRLLAEKAVLQKQADDLRAIITAIHEDKGDFEKPADEPHETPMDSQKPLTVESIRTALRFNGYSPEIPDTHEPRLIAFKMDDTVLRIIASDIPFLGISVGFALNEPEGNLPLLQKAAEDTTAHAYIGKVCLVEDGTGVFFSAEFFCDSYVEFRNRLALYLRVVKDTSRRFFEAYDRLKSAAKKEQDAVFSGESFLQAEQTNSKKIQS